MTEPLQTAISAISSLNGSTKFDAKYAGITTQLLLPFGTLLAAGTLLASLHLIFLAECVLVAAGISLAAYLVAYFIQFRRDPASLQPPHVIIENSRQETMKYSIDAIARDPSIVRAVEEVSQQILPAPSRSSE